MAFRMGLILAAVRCAASHAVSSSAIHYPDPNAAEENAFALFNSIHSAMRQFGSSVHHNGLTFYLAQAPEGSVFYHGDYRISTPPGFEWLAFEFEHAQIFAESWEPRENLEESSFETETLIQHRLSHRMQPLLSSTSQAAMSIYDQTASQYPIVNDKEVQGNKSGDSGGPYFPDQSKPARGYFHTYVANRPLNLLYIGGESAAKCDLGPMDSQDYILLDKEQRGWRGEMARASELCDLAEEWKFEAGGKIDGFVRMEAGFEIIYCDFFDGLDLLSVQASPFQNETGIEYDPSKDFWLGLSSRTLDFEWLRAVAARFHGHPAGRLDVDWSSAVSAFAYPLNLSNPDWSRQDLPRVINATREDRLNIRARLREVVVNRGGRTAAEKGVVNWQGVVDKIITRFSTRLWEMDHAELNANELLAVLGTLINPFIDYLDNSSAAEQLANDRCARHFLNQRLLPPENWTPEDNMIATAVGAVSRAICTSLFSAREVLRSNTAAADIDLSIPAVNEARGIIQKLISNLRWSTWKECGNCGPDEICSIPMFPRGSEEDYFHPRCKNATGMLSSFGYWRFQ